MLELARLINELGELLVKEKKMWQQRSKVHCMKSSDKNSRYFHNKALQRFRRNRIMGLKDNVAGLLETYYQDLFTSSNPSEVEDVIQHTDRVVTEGMNNGLIGDFTRDEVEQAYSSWLQ